MAFAAARCGWKLSFPKRSGNKSPGDRQAAFVPRPAASGTSTAPPAGAESTIFCSSELSINGMSAGTTKVLFAPRFLHTAVAISMALVSPELSSATTSKLKRAAKSRANESLVTTATGGRLCQLASACSTSSHIARASAKRSSGVKIGDSRCFASTSFFTGTRIIAAPPRPEPTEIASPRPTRSLPARFYLHSCA